MIPELKDLKDAIDKHQKENAEFQTRNDARIETIEKKGYAPANVVKTVEDISASLTKQEKTISDIKAALNRAPISDGNGKPELTAEQKAANKTRMDYICKGIVTPELKTLVSNNDPQAGYLISDQQQETFDLTFRELSPFIQLAKVVTLTKGNTAVFPVNKKGGVGFTWSDEVSESSETGAQTRGVRRITAYMGKSLTLVGAELLEDSDQNVDAWLGVEAGEDFAAGANAAFFLGNVPGRPTGFLTLDAGTGEDQIQQIISGASGGFTRDGIVNLYHALKVFYRPGAVFMASSLSITAIRLLKDLEGRFSLISDFSKSPEPTLIGKPLIEATDMPDVTGGALALAFANFNFGYCVVQRQEIMLQRFIEKFEPFIGFKYKRRIGGNVRREEAIKLQVISA